MEVVQKSDVIMEEFATATVVLLIVDVAMDILENTVNTVRSNCCRPGPTTPVPSPQPQAFPEMKPNTP